MLSTRDLSLGTVLPADRRARRCAASLLLAASRFLDALARRLAAVPSPERAPDAVIEFHAEAGAPEGALYADGRLVGHLVGVNRL